jgi:hypothetical protein
MPGMVLEPRSLPVLQALLPLKQHGVSLSRWVRHGAAEAGRGERVAQRVHGLPGDHFNRGHLSGTELAAPTAHRGTEDRFLLQHAGSPGLIQEGQQGAYGGFWLGHQFLVAHLPIAVGPLTPG